MPLKNVIQVSYRRSLQFLKQNDEKKHFSVQLGMKIKGFIFINIKWFPRMRGYFSHKISENISNT